mgnify:FL=1|tara:strand:+ start:74 stop:790 length:717 start_codon:yes stop_codon:yes gene_type:complete
MKKFFRRKIINLLRFFISILITKKGKDLTKDAIILGRGVELEDYYKNFNKLNMVKNVFTINFKKEDIGENLISLRNKNIFPVLNIEEPVMSILQIIKLNISECFIARTKDQIIELKNKRNFNANLYGKVNLFEGQKVKEFFDKKISTSGLLTVIFLTKVIGVKNIFIFGFDFYQEGMYKISDINNFDSIESIKIHKENGKKSLMDFKKFIIENPHINFYFPKKTKININTRNFKLLDF